MEYGKIKLQRCVHFQQSERLLTKQTTDMHAFPVERITEKEKNTEVQRSPFLRTIEKKIN